MSLPWSHPMILNTVPLVLCSKSLSGSKVDSAIHHSEVDQMSTRNIW